METTCTLVGSYVTTPGFAALSLNNAHATAFGLRAVRTIMQAKANDEKPDMVVGEPGGKAARAEDGGRTLVVPIPSHLPRLFAIANEVNTVTVMLAEEY